MAQRLCRRLRWLVVAAGLTMTLPAAVPADAVLAGKVTRVIDGDTMDVLLDSGLIRVRLHGIDAPERNQAGGSAAAAWLTQRLRDQAVELEPVSQDQYSRMVAVVHHHGRNVNLELVRAGHAWAYRRYMRRANRELCSIEAQARHQQAGLWTTATAHAPWEFRVTDGKGPFTDFSASTAGDCRKAIGRR